MSAPTPVATTYELVKNCYERLSRRVSNYRGIASRPLTLSEKIIAAHSTKPLTEALAYGGFCHLSPDRLAMQDATAQMALLQFIQSCQPQVKLPSTVHCDHLILAYKGVDQDLPQSFQENQEVFEFLKSACQRYGIGFWGPGSGIIHQIVLENYAFPGGLMIGTDSHTPNAGGLGMIAVGVGGADAVDVMVGMPWELATPKIVAVHLSGQLSGWSAPKDVILKVLDQLTVKGGKDIIFEYIGDGARSLSCTGKGTITNMGAELGATTSLFAFDDKMADYLCATGREEIAQLAHEYSSDLTPDSEVLAAPEQYYDDVVHIDLDTLEPHIVGPHTPDLARAVSKMAEDVSSEGYPDKIAAALIGSCTNSSYEDLYKATHVVEKLLESGLKAQVPFFITPGSTTVYNTVASEGMLSTLEKFGGTILANACGPCIGQWKRDDITPGEANSIVTSFNRNFRGRNDANKATLGFITSPEMVVAYAASGSLSFDPQKDTLISEQGKEVVLAAPQGKELPVGGLKLNFDGYLDPPSISSEVRVEIGDNSSRLAFLQPFTPWDGEDFHGHRLLFKALGKCTTDHISPAGRWLRYRGHLDKISDNLLWGGQNAFVEESGKCRNLLLDDAPLASCSEVARAYQKAGERWVIVGEDNYGEGSSREHAAMTPRHLGASVVLVKSFARIHATNLKKQGVLALTFKNPKDYDTIAERDRISVLGLADFQAGRDLEVVIHSSDDKTHRFAAEHSYNEEQIRWFKAGSALNSLLGSKELGSKELS